MGATERRVSNEAAPSSTLSLGRPPCSSRRRPNWPSAGRLSSPPTPDRQLIPTRLPPRQHTFLTSLVDTLIGALAACRHSWALRHGALRRGDHPPALGHPTRRSVRRCETCWVGHRPRESGGSWCVSADQI